MNKEISKADDRIVPGACYGTYDSKSTLCTKVCEINRMCNKTTQERAGGFKDKSPIKPKEISKSPFETFIQTLNKSFSFIEEQEKGTSKAYFYDGFHIVFNETKKFQVNIENSDSYVCEALQTVDEAKEQFTKLKGKVDAHL